MWETSKRLTLGFALIALAAAILLVSDWQHRVPAPAEIPRVALFQYATRPLLDDCMDGVVEGLASEGWMPGQTVETRKFNAENDLPTANGIARAIVDERFDMVITITTPCLQVMASANREGKVVHVFGSVTDPFGASVGISRDDPLKHPSHLVGIGTFQPVKETFRLAKKLNPKLKTVGEVWNPGEACSDACTKLAREVCQELEIQLLEAHVDASSGVREAAQSLVSRGVEALWIGGDNTVEMATDAVAEVAASGRIPVFNNSPGQIGKGILFGLGANYHEVGRQTAQLAARVLRGADPAAIEIRNVMPRKLAVNLKILARVSPPWNLPEDVLKTAADVVDASGNLVAR
jgi:ABC-type uncharacterized transport system substrate-binding protein